VKLTGFSSCTLCRKRKIRCNKETPCSNCVKSKTGSCVYETDVPEQAQSANVGLLSIQPRQPEYTSSVSTPSSQFSFEFHAMRARVTELEEKLAHTASSASSVYSAPVTAYTPASSTHPVQFITSFAGNIDVLQETRFAGRAPISRCVAHKNRLFGQTHWMNGFVMFRDMIEMMEPILRSGASGVVPNIHRAKLLAQVIKSQRSPTWPTPASRDLPPKHVCDDLVACYLRTMESVYRVLHVPSFQRVYDELWASNAEPSMAFVMVLKLVLAIGATVYDDGFSMRVDAIRWVYEAQTWLSCPTFKSQLGIQYLQMSILLVLARELVDVGSELVWISVGAVYRTAVYIGLHKDPSQLPRMTLLEAEMRRRIWNTILEISLQESMLSGGPCLFSLEDFNTAPPRNYDDEQLTTTDPIARPDDTHTQTLVAIALRKTLPARLAILKFLNDLASNGTYEATLRLDTELRTAYKSLRRAMSAYTATNSLSTTQFTPQAVNFIMQRYITSLHLPFFVSAVDDPVYAFSRKATVDSSLRIWSLAYPVTNDDPFPPPETDLSRVSRCAAGFFRTYAFHATTFLATELRARLLEDDDDTSTTSGPLSTVIDNAASWYLRCMQAGETSLKGYILLRLLAVRVDTTKRHVDRSELPSLLIQASEQATEVCMPILEIMAGGSGQNFGGANGSEGMNGMDFDFQMSSEFMEDWDMIMSNSFSPGDAASFNAFLL
jgi:hypothetical protein